MATARKEMAKTMAKVDMIIEVLDARLPGASSNPLIKELRDHRQRPSLKVLNKSDLADPAATAEWLRAFEAQPLTKAIAISSKRATDVAKLPRLAASMVPHRDSTLKPVRIMVVGIPNVGKSTLINALLKRRVAGVGDEPGITKNQARFEINNRMELIDTPGLLWPAIRLPSDGLILAASHAIGVNAYIDEEVATYLADVLLARCPRTLCARYKLVSAPSDGPSMIEAIAKQRGLRTRGDNLDLEKAALVLLKDYRSGALGPISLETPATRALQLSEAADQHL